MIVCMIHSQIQVVQRQRENAAFASKKGILG